MDSPRVHARCSDSLYFFSRSTTFDTSVSVSCLLSSLFVTLEVLDVVLHLIHLAEHLSGHAALHRGCGGHIGLLRSRRTALELRLQRRMQSMGLLLLAVLAPRRGVAAVAAGAH